MKTVYLYEGTIPKSGKQCLEFDGVKLVHRSVKMDKCDILVEPTTGIIVRVYYFGTSRGKVLDDIANNIESLKHFLSHSEQFNIVNRPKITKQKEKPSKDYLYPVKPPSYSIDGRKKTKRSFNIGDSTW